MQEKSYTLIPYDQMSASAKKIRDFYSIRKDAPIYQNSGTMCWIAGSRKDT